MSVRAALLFLPLMIAGCADYQATDVRATATDQRATDTTKPTAVLDTATADEMVKVWGTDAPPGSVDELQRRTYTEFAGTMGFGIERITPPPGHYVPTVPGRYTLDGKPIDFTAAYPSDDPRHGRWTIENLQLLGLMKKPAGQVYVVKKDERRRVSADPLSTEGLKVDPATVVTSPNARFYPQPEDRPLNAFELAALESFRHRNGHVETRSDADGLHVVGAIRAVKNDCMKCHNVEKYTLLGAFVYDLKMAK